MLNETPEWAIKAARTTIGLYAKAVQNTLGGNIMAIPEEIIMNNARLIYLEWQKAALDEELKELKELEAAHE